MNTSGSNPPASASDRPCPATGLALGSGAARGLAHIGVLHALEERDIRIDLLAGTSIGALIGALYASGVPVARLEQVACELHWRRLAGLIVPGLPASGLIDSRKLDRFISELLPVQTFEELSTPLAVTTTDIETGELVVIRQGLLLPAIRAAIAFPGLFAPVKIGERFLVDGGLCAPVPTDIVRQMGAETVIGVCTIPIVDKRVRETRATGPLQPSRPTTLLQRFTPDWIESTIGEIWTGQNRNASNKEDREERTPPGLFRVFAQSIAILENQINALRLDQERIDYLIRPDLGHVSLLDFHKAQLTIETGRAETHRCFETCD